MKRFIPILLILILILSGCGKASEKENLSTAEVVINMPADDTVNGYRTNENTKTPQSISATEVTVDDSSANKSTLDYCGNKSSKTFHKSSCRSVNTMKESNKYFADRDTLILAGYHPCENCKP